MGSKAFQWEKSGVKESTPLFQHLVTLEETQARSSKQSELAQKDGMSSKQHRAPIQILVAVKGQFISFVSVLIRTFYGEYVIC